VLLSSMSFMEDSVVNGYLMIEYVSTPFFLGVLLRSYFGFRVAFKVFGL
jgi:hypothetical protein